MTARDSSGLYYGWIIAVASGVILLVTNGMTLAGLNVFDKPLLDALTQASGEPVSLAGLKTRDAITLAVSGLIAPLAGAAADRFGVRPLMVLGALLLSAGYFLYSTVDSLSDIYAIHVLFASALASCGLVVNVILVSRWFIKDRGLALGIALAGTSLGNGTLPPLNALLMAEVGWRPAFVWISLLPLLLIPVILFVIRERPVDLWRQQRTTGPAGSHSADPVSLPLGAALRTTNFWVLALIAMCTFFAIIGTQAHLNLYMLGRGYSQIDAGLSYTVLFYLGLMGKITSGFLADRLGRKRVFTSTIAVMAGGAMLLTLPSSGVLWAGLLMFGLGWGGLYTLLQLLAADYFGPRHLGKILGAVTVLDTLGGGLGPPLIGAIRDSTGSYSQAFALVTGLVLLALILSTRFRLPEATARTTPV
ncbi:MAG: MFS transporter [Gammaproteobacteria bacterium]|nr:MFS transporter [Gammaproteobacteria bacterium]MDH5275466.1 MFS transporter [Gammaproteobacteria bacterium]